MAHPPPLRLSLQGSARGFSERALPGALLPAFIVASAMMMTAARADAPANSGADHNTRIVGPRRDADATIDRARLERDALPDLGRILEEEPGLRVTRLGGLGAFATLSIRGSTAEQVMVLLDGIPLNGADGGPVDLGQIPLGPLAAIDIHRGFLPARYGVPAMGGALVLRTRPIQSAEIAADVGAGSFGTVATRLAAGASGFALHLDYLGTAGDFRFVDDAGTRWTSNDDVIRTRQNNDLQRFSGLLRGRVDITPELRIDLLHLITLSERGLPGLGVHPTTVSAFDLRRHVSGIHTTLTIDQTTTSLTLHHALSDTEILDPLGEIGPPSAVSTLTSQTPGATWTLQHRTLTEDLEITGEVHAAWRSETASGTRIAENSRHLLTVGLSGAITLPDPALSFHLDSQLLAAPASGDDTPVGDASRFIATWFPDPDHRLGLTLTRSFRLPSLYERFGDTGLVLGNPDLVPERAHGLELAWQTRLATPTPAGDLDLRFQLHVFSRWHDDLIQFIQNAQNVARPENIASAFITGAEAELTVNLDTWLETRVTAAWLHTRDTSTIAARRGRELPLRPPLSVGTHLTFKPDDILAISLDLHTISSNHLDAANLVTTAPRALLGATITTRIDDFRVTLSVMNLLDNRIADLAGFPLPGLSAFANLRWEPTR